MPERPTLSRRKLLKRGLGLGALAVVGDAYGIEPEWIDVERVEIPVHGLGKAFDGYRIALLSDFHWPRHVTRKTLRRAIAKANAFEPDLVAIPGDLCDGKPGSPTPDLRGLFDDLRSRDGIVGTLGNHDHWLGNVERLRNEIARNTPIELIENRHRLLRRRGDALAVGGTGDLWCGVVDPVAAFAGVSDDVPRIMLSHNPDVAEDVAWPVRIDLQLSGHTHGGQVRLPFGPAPCIPSKYGQKFREGLVQGRSHRVYVTRGVCSIRHIRFFCRPEVTYLTLRSA